MSLYRVVISFMLSNIHYMAERGILAMTPGQALDDVISKLDQNHTKSQDFKSHVSRPEKLDDFSPDAQMLICLNTNRSVKDFWHKRFDA